MTTPAVAAFRVQLREVHGATDDVEVRPAPPGLDVPSFVTLVADVSGREVRGWARDDGAVVMHARQNFGLLLDAARFADSSPALGARELVERLVWSHGADCELVERVEAGELELDHALVTPVRRAVDAQGLTELRFSVRYRDQTGRPTEIMHYRLQGAADRSFRVDLWQLAPEVPDDD